MLACELGGARVHQRVDDCEQCSISILDVAEEYSQACQVDDGLVDVAVAGRTDPVLGDLFRVSRRHSYRLSVTIVQQAARLIGAVSAVIGRVTEL